MIRLLYAIIQYTAIMQTCRQKFRNFVYNLFASWSSFRAFLLDFVSFSPGHSLFGMHPRMTLSKITTGSHIAFMDNACSFIWMLASSSPRCILYICRHLNVTVMQLWIWYAIHIPTPTLNIKRGPLGPSQKQENHLILKLRIPEIASCVEKCCIQQVEKIKFPKLAHVFP